MENIIIPNPAELEKKKLEFKNDGKESIHILSDFDRTITKAFSKGKKIPSIISILRDSNKNYISKEYIEKAHELYNKYHPIEISQTLSIEDKKKKMLEWWNTHYKLLIENGLTKEIINKAVKEAIDENILVLRNNSKDFFKILKDNKIPLIIMSSSGLGNAVNKFLELSNCLSNNVYFIGNTLEFNKEGKFTGIKDNKIIHIFNKQEIELKNLPLYEEIKNKSNVILLGDSLGDLSMLENSDYKNIIKIAFYNDNEENLEEFKKNFDVIITNDGSFDYINELMTKLLHFPS
jgi:5'-nucleotidase